MDAQIPLLATLNREAVGYHRAMHWKRDLWDNMRVTSHGGINMLVQVQII